MSVDHIEIHLREQQLEEYKFSTSSTPALIALEMLGKPEFKGTVVDLAAGASSLTAHLLDNGVDAHAVDRFYLGGRDAVEEAIDHYLFEMSDAFMYNWAMRDMVQESLETFRASLERFPERYHGGWLTQELFPKDLADFAVSTYGFLTLADDEEILDLAMQRVLGFVKPGGKIIMAPLYEFGDPDYFREPHTRMIDKLRDSGVRNVSVESYLTSACHGCYHERLAVVR